MAQILRDCVAIWVVVWYWFWSWLRNLRGVFDSLLLFGRIAVFRYCVNCELELRGFDVCAAGWVCGWVFTWRLRLRSAVVVLVTITVSCFAGCDVDFAALCRLFGCFLVVLGIWC